jgi:hypothetical protein
MQSLLRRAAFQASLFVWARCLPLLAQERDLQTLLRRVHPHPRKPYAGMLAEQILHSVKSSCTRPWLMRDRRCLREGLLAFRFLYAAGYRPRLHFGVDRDSIGRGRLAAHCWVSLDGAIVLNPPLPTYVEIHAVQ